MWIDPAELSDEVAISAITLAELSAGPHQVRPTAKQALYEEHAERAWRLEILQRVANEFDTIPFGPGVARSFGRLTAAVVASARQPRRWALDVLIAATAVAEGLPLFTINPADFAGLGGLLDMVPITRPSIQSAR